MAIDDVKQLSAESQRLLLEVARKTIESHLNQESRPKSQIFDTELLVRRGLFVVLKMGEELRGCIGYITSQNSLYQTVAQAVVGVATKDSRFEPVQAKELVEIEIESSVLTPLEGLQKVGDIEIGANGLYITQEGQSGLLLPQVAASYGWDRSQFLQRTCGNTRLPDTEIYFFNSKILVE